MEEKWSMDFKKLKKSSSKKLIKGGLGFFLSPRDEGKDNKEGSPTTSKDIQGPNAKKTNSWENEALNTEHSEVEVQSKDFIDDIPIIPSLDDFVDDDLTNQIAKAPLVGVKQVATYKELENNILRHSAFATFEEVNLQVLIKHLHPESCLDEPDTPWTKDGLFNEMWQIDKGGKNWRYTENERKTEDIEGKSEEREMLEMQAEKKEKQEMQREKKKINTKTVRNYRRSVQ